MSRSQSHVEDDTGSDGWYLVSGMVYHDVSTADCLRLTNDGHAILREIDVAHPAAKSMIELSRTQDEEVGDGTTSVIILGSLTPLINADDQLVKYWHIPYHCSSETSTLSSSSERSNLLWPMPCRRLLIFLSLSISPPKPICWH